MRSHATARLAVVALLGLCLLATVAVSAAAGPVEQPGTAAPPADVQNATDARPGSALADALARHEARVGGSLEAAVLEADLESAPSNRSRARRLASFEAMLESVVEGLRAEHAAVRRPEDDRVARRQRVPTTQARAIAAGELAEHADETARSLPENATESSGLDPDAFDRHARESQSIAENGSDDRDDGSHDDFVLTGSPDDWRDGPREDDWGDDGDARHGGNDRYEGDGWSDGGDPHHETAGRDANLWHSDWSAPWMGHGWGESDGVEPDGNGSDGGRDAAEPHATDGAWYDGTERHDGPTREDASSGHDGTTGHDGPTEGFGDEDGFENHGETYDRRSELPDGWEEEATGWNQHGDDGDGDWPDDGSTHGDWSSDGSGHDGWSGDDSGHDGWEESSTEGSWESGDQTDGGDASGFEDDWSDPEESSTAHDGGDAWSGGDGWSDGDEFDGGW